MAYSSVKTPRFIIDWLQWWKELGLIKGRDIYMDMATMTSHEDEALGIENMMGLPPTSQTTVTNFEEGGNGVNYRMTGTIQPFPIHDINIVGLLGHNLGDYEDAELGFVYFDNSNESASVKLTNTIAINTGTSNDVNIQPYYNGFSFRSADGSHDSSKDPGINGGQSIVPVLRNVFGSDVISISSMIMGRYYDMPANPNLSLTLSREYKGLKNTNTYMGHSLSNSMWNKAPSWGDLPAWGLSDPNNPSTDLNLMGQSGRRIWDLKFSYIDDRDLFGSNQSLSNINFTSTNYDSGDITNDGDFEYNLINDDSFFPQVWHKTLGGTLPFVFQPDKDVNEFAICRFADSSLKATQSAHNVYDISLKIEEVW